MTPKERSWGSVLEPGADQLINRCFYASRQSGRRLDRHRGNADPCHTTPLVATPATDCRDLQDVSMGGTGLEPVTPSLSSSRSRQFAAVRSGSMVERISAPRPNVRANANER